MEVAFLAVSGGVWLALALTLVLSVVRRRRPRSRGWLWLGAGILLLLSVTVLSQFASDHDWPLSERQVIARFGLIVIPMAIALVVAGVVIDARSRRLARSAASKSLGLAAWPVNALAALSEIRTR